MTTKTLQRFIPWQSFNEFFVSIVYFVQGAGSLTAIAAMAIQRDQLDLNFLQMGMIAATSLLPWSIKPIFGVLTDLVPIGKFRRRPYLHIGPLIAVAGYLLIAFYGHSYETFIIPLIFANIGLSLTDVATDGFVVEESDENNAARIQGLTQASIRTATFITSFFSGLLITSKLVTPHGMYLILALFPLLTFIASFYIKEKPISELALFETSPENSISTESSLEYYQTKKFDLKIFTPAYISSLIIIFTLLISNMIFSEKIAAFVPFSPGYLTTGIWLLFGVWMLSYFDKLKKMKLTSSMIYIAILFILLWRINPGAGTPLYFYMRDSLLIGEKTIGFISTASQIGSIIGIIVAVKIFDKIPLKKLLIATVVISAIFSFNAFAVTHSSWGDSIGSSFLISRFAMIIAYPIYFLEHCFNLLITGIEWEHPITFIKSLLSTPLADVKTLSGMEKFLFFNEIIEQFITMIAYIPLLKFAVLITPKKAEATNFAIITSIMNIGLVLSAWISGALYTQFMIWWRPALKVTDIDVGIMDYLIWINIISTLVCLLVLPFLKTKEFVKITKE